MRQIIMSVLLVLMAQPALAQELTQPESVIHIAQVGDTFESLAARYDTCVGVIIWENGLSRAAPFSSNFLVEAGTPLIILPRSECANLPTGRYEHIVQEGETGWGLAVRYCMPPTLKPVEPGQILVIDPIEDAYDIDEQPSSGPKYSRCYTKDHLVVYGDDDLVINLYEHYRTEDIAECFGTTVEAINTVNHRDSYQAGGIGWNLSYAIVIPHPSHPCALQYRGKPAGSVEEVACYPQPLEQTAGLTESDNQDDVYQDSMGRYCYSIEKAYDMLFKPLGLDWIVAHSEYDMTPLAWQNIARCIGVSENEIEQVNNRSYYPSGVVPPTPNEFNKHIYLVPRPRRDCYLFQPDLLRTQHIHVIQSRETLSGIAARYDLFTFTLAGANGIQDWNELRTGEWLFIPDRPTRTELAAVAGIILILMSGLGALKRVVT